ncbi:MAG TPA: YdcF family protein [Pyrinomonadaceae bacterium]|nr:YdcF family protein [Pyrinomonadaceae bacterium]
MATDAKDETLKRERRRQHATRTRRLGRAAMLLLAAWPLAAWCAARALIVEVNVAQPEAIVVLSGASAYAERARVAAALFASGRAPKIILTNDSERGGWSSAEQRNPFFSELAAAELARAGVPAEKIEFVAQAVSNTYDEARAVRDYAAARNMRSLLVVTSAYHSRRAEWTWRRVFSGSEVNLGITTAPAEGASPALWWLRARGWRAVASEYPKLIYYRLRYS